MADTDIGWAHAQALADMLADLPYTVHVGEVTDDTLPYIVLWPPPATRPTITLAGYGGEATTATQITAAGASVREVLAALDRVAARLHRRRPTIPGRRCGLVTQVEGAATPPQPGRDEQVSTPDRPVFSSFLQFSLFSARNPGAI
ncbi:MAG TPA: hypothetical protein VGD43_05200 [Micromonospora sp.]